MNKSKTSQIKKYGSLEAYREEMSRRQSLRKTKYRHFDDPEMASQAAKKRHEIRKSRPTFQPLHKD